MKFKTIIKIIILPLLLAACQPLRKVTIDNFHIYETPPNGIKISENLYCDQSEVENVSWREYMYWNKKIFGSQSEEYKSILPDTLVWKQADNCLNYFVEQYLRNPAYNDHPVVGLSQKLAEDYSKWRSDRVFEFLLIKYKIMEWDSAQTRDNYFTIERYFKGEVKTLISAKKVYYYPEFRLPSISERQLILAYSDSVDKAYFNTRNSKKNKYCKENNLIIWSDISPCIDDTLAYEPTRIIPSECYSKKSQQIFDLRGNIREWLAEPNTSAGGGWKDNKEQILDRDIFINSMPNAWTGFRNVCEWKRWEE